jgi:hypothetical protein
VGFQVAADALAEGVIETDGGVHPDELNPGARISREPPGPRLPGPPPRGVPTGCIGFPNWGSDGSKSPVVTFHRRARSGIRFRSGRGWRGRAAAALRISPLCLVGLLLAQLLLTPSAHSSPPADSAASPRHGLAVARPRAEGFFAPLAEGTREWLAAVIATAGVETVERSRVRAASERVLAGGRGALRGSDAPALAGPTGAALILMSELHYRAGQAEVRLRLHDGVDGSLVSATLNRGSAGELGVLLRTAAVGLLDSIDFPSDSVAAEPAPSLAELGAYGRALDHEAGAGSSMARAGGGSRPHRRGAPGGGRADRRRPG